MYKLSKYNHFVSYKDKYLIYNSITNTIVPFDIEHKKLIDWYFYNLPEFYDTSPKLFEKFIKWGFLIESDFNEIDFLKLRNNQEVYYNRYLRITINPTLNCNMNCWYCTVKASSVSRADQGMKEEIVDRILKYFDNKIAYGQIDGIFLDWFGGEPLLHFDKIINKIGSFVSKKTIANKIDFFHNITTNGYLINREIIRKMDEINLRNFQITLDGNEKRHNKIRKHGEQPSFKTIINNIIDICNLINNPSIILRINYDKKTLKDISDIIDYFPLEVRKHICVSFQKVFQISKDQNNENEQLIKNMEIFRNAGFKVRYWAFRPQWYHTCYSDKYAHFVINYDGSIYKCTARDYSDNLKIGFIDENGVMNLNESKLAKYFSVSTFENERCLKCKLLPLCFGPCIQKTYESNINNEPIECLIEDSEITIETFIIQEAIKRELIMS
jgi:uncharacterized protein